MIPVFLDVMLYTWVSSSMFQRPYDLSKHWEPLTQQQSVTSKTWNDCTGGNISGWWW